jgi:hypothetical protein
MTLTMEEHDDGELEGQGGDRDGRVIGGKRLEAHV